MQLKVIYSKYVVHIKQYNSPLHPLHYNSKKNKNKNTVKSINSLRWKNPLNNGNKIKLKLENTECKKSS